MAMMSLWFPDKTAVQQDNHIQASTKRNHFVQAGIEKKSGATGFAYGSEKIYDNKFVRHASLNDQKKIYPERVKLEKQQKEFEENHQAYLSQKKVEKQRRLEEQQNDLKQLQQYYPWGKPAGGAPRYTPSGAPQTRILRHLPQVDPETGYNPYGRPGGGAPLRTDSGRIATQIKGAKDIGFPDHLKREMRHGEEKPIGKTLQITLDRTDSEKLQIAEERHKKLAYGKRLEEQRLEAIARRERDKKELLDSPTGYIWGRDKGVFRDDSGKLLPRKVVINSDAYTSRESAGTNSIASQMMRGAQRKATNKPHKNTIMDELFDPWGKPGAGAPLRDGEGQVKASSVYTRDKRSAHLMVSLDKTEASRGDGVDMATIIRGQPVKPIGNNNQEKDYYTDLQAEAEKRYQQHQQKKCKQQQPFPGMWSKGERTRPVNEQDLARSKEYSDELRRAIEAKSLKKKQSKENNIHMEKQHVLAFAEHWGRPGAGAPRTDNQGRVEAVHRNMSVLQTQVHTDQRFRN